MIDLNEYIKGQGGVLSGQLATYISRSQNISEATARKRIERLVSPIHKIKGFFADNQSFIYHSSNFNSQMYFEKLEKAFEIAAKRCQAFITAINYSHGVILKSDLPNYTFCPTSKIKGHVLYSTLIEKLIQAKVISEMMTNIFT
jgi:hypothetical protein